VLFTGEVVLRFLADRLEFILGKDLSWNAFDVVLVLTGYTAHLIPTGNFAFARLMRLARAIRMVHMMRTNRAFKGLRRMVKSVMNCSLSMLWLLLLLCTITYMFAVCFMQGLANTLATKPVTAPKTTDLAALYGSIYESMLTLFMAISGGMDWKDALSPITNTSPAFGLVFLFYILLMVFGVLNIITGVFIDSVFEIAQGDREFQILEEIEKSKHDMRAFMSLFQRLDVNGDGVLTKEEMLESLKNKWVEGYLISLDVDVSIMHDLFDLMDTFGSGEVTVQDFVQGCMQARGAATSMDMYALSMQTRSYHLLVWEFMDNVDRRFDHVVDIVSRKLASSDKDDKS